MIERFGMKGCNPAFTPGVAPELSLNQPEEKLLDEETKKRYKTITGAVMYLGQVSRYDILFSVNQLARAMSKPLYSQMAAAKHLLRYLADCVHVSITYKQEGVRLAA